jgi:hypothetical protein
LKKRIISIRDLIFRAKTGNITEGTEDKSYGNSESLVKNEAIDDKSFLRSACIESEPNLKIGEKDNQDPLR